MQKELLKLNNLYYKLFLASLLLYFLFCVGQQGNAEVPSAMANAFDLILTNRCFSNFCVSIKADSHIACRAHAVPLPCRATKYLECVFPI
jgi:hypothetical protein